MLIKRENFPSLSMPFENRNGKLKKIKISSAPKPSGRQFSKIKTSIAIEKSPQKRENFTIIVLKLMFLCHTLVYQNTAVILNLFFASGILKSFEISHSKFIANNFK